MAIEFRCPNGHRLSCPDDRAGKPAKCPKCNITFTVPTLEAAAAASASSSGLSMPAVADSGTLSSIGKAGKIEEASEQGGAPPGDVIVFLCPNGHKLNCPSSMQGKAGKCPHCGAKFLIPQYGAEEAGEDEPTLEEADEPQPEGELELEMADEPQHSAPDSRGSSPPDLPFDFAEIGAAPESGSVLPGIFNELWMHHDQTLVIEVQLRSGATLTPHHYSPHASRDGYAIFAVKEPHGAYTLSVVAWDQIERITVRGMSELPPEYFS